MPFLGSLFNCSSKDDVKETNKSNQSINNIKQRLNRLEEKYDDLHSILIEIKLDIKMINFNIQQITK